jgi:hypothetical protein
MSHDEMHYVCIIISRGNALGNFAILSFFFKAILLALLHPSEGTLVKKSRKHVNKI